MGKIKNNIVTKGFSGKLGDDLVFRQIDDQTIFTRRTEIDTEPTARQLEIRDKFSEAALFASAALENPQAGLEYKLMAEVQGLKSAYIAAVTDYLTLPEIGGVFTVFYKGVPGDTINIKPSVPYKVVDIDVSIVDAGGAVVESGKAVLNELKWRYTATQANGNVAGSKIVLTARDRHGKESTFERVLR
jgi:hypothetical protein